MLAHHASARRAVARGLLLRLAARERPAVRRLTVGAAAAPATLTIVTPVTGHRHMRRALRAVQAQDCAPGLLTHLVFIDGPRPGVDAASLRALSTRHPVHVVQLPYAVGTNGWLGHRMYGAACFLNDSTYVSFLDEDNSLDADHASSWLSAAEQAGLPEWGHSLRKVYDSAGRFLCLDLVDSLGTLAPSLQSQRPFVDTNNMFIRRDIAPLVAQHWYHTRTGADAAVSAALCAHHAGICTKRFTVSYVAASSANSNGVDHFTRPTPLPALAELGRTARVDTTPLGDD